MSKVKKELLAPCGLYCGVCSIYIAHRDNNVKFKQVLLPIYKAFAKNIEDISCTGCLSNDIVFPVCRHCAIKKCTKNKGIEGCHQCDEFPCKLLIEFNNDGMPHHSDAINNLRKLRKVGEESWLADQAKRWECECGAKLSWYLKKCTKCLKPAKINYIVNEKK